MTNFKIPHFPVIQDNKLLFLLKLVLTGFLSSKTERAQRRLRIRTRNGGARGKLNWASGIGKVECKTLAIPVSRKLVTPNLKLADSLVTQDLNHV